MTEDPVKDGMNWYQYCGSDPVNWVDPLGLVCGEAVADPNSAKAIIDGLKAAAAVAAIEPTIIGEIAVGVAVVSALTNEDVREQIKEELTNIYNSVKDSILNYKEHKKNARKSTKSKHEKGQTRNKKDNRGEKGDARRPY
jgi:glycogen synthase